MRAKAIGCEKRLAPDRRARLERRLAVGDPARGAVEHRPQLLLVEPGDLRRAQRDQQRARLLPVGIVGGVDDLLGRDEVVEAEQVDRAPDRGVEVDAGHAAEGGRQRGEVGDPGVGDDQLRARVGVDEPAQVVGDRRQAAAAVDQDRHAALGGELEHRRQPLVVQQELLGTRVELDPARAEVEAARGLLDRLLGQVEPHERDQAPARALGVGERAVVGRAEGRVAVDLVHAEHEAARDPVGAR